MFDASALSPETIRLCVDALRFGKLEREHGMRPDYARVDIALARVDLDLSIARQTRLSPPLGTEPSLLAALKRTLAIAPWADLTDKQLELQRNEGSETAETLIAARAAIAKAESRAT